MTLHRWSYKAKNCEIHDPKSLKNKLDGPWVAFLAKKGEELPQLCVCHMAIEASSLPFIAIHTNYGNSSLALLPTHDPSSNFG